MLGLAALLGVAVVAGLAVVLLSREAPVDPADQATPGPVLLVPGYGGSTDGLSVLAAALDDEGRDARVVPAPGDGRGDLREQAENLADAVDEALDDSGAPSVDLVGYSAGGVVVRWYVDQLDGAGDVRRAVTLSSPHHGTDLAALAGDLAGDACPEACQQLAPDSDVLRTLNAGDETTPGPLWAALWTTDDQTVVPPTSGTLEGAVDFSVQSVCPDLSVSHGQMPSTPAVIAMVQAELGTDEPAVPDASVCDAG